MSSEEDEREFTRVMAECLPVIKRCQHILRWEAPDTGGHRGELTCKEEATQDAFCLIRQREIIVCAYHAAKFPNREAPWLKRAKR